MRKILSEMTGKSAKTCDKFGFFDEAGETEAECSHAVFELGHSESLEVIGNFWGRKTDALTRRRGGSGAERALPGAGTDTRFLASRPEGRLTRLVKIHATR